MFVIVLELTDKRDRAPELMESHNEWVARGFDDGVFLLVGGLKGAPGGAILAHDTGLPELRRRVDEDPFVAEGVVDARIIELAPWKADDRLAFLVG